jgi:hypothetical protein
MLGREKKSMRNHLASVAPHLLVHVNGPALHRCYKNGQCVAAAAVFVSFLALKG